MSNETDLRAISPLREIYGVYQAKNHTLTPFSVEIETEADNQMKIFTFENEDHYIVSLAHGGQILERRLVPVAAEPRMVEMLMSEMLTTAENNLRDAVAHSYKDILGWNDKYTFVPYR